MVSAGAKGLSPYTVGSNSKIGAGAVVLSAVPEGCTVVGIPGRVVKQYNVKIDPCSMDQRLPDPILDELQNLCSRVSELERKLKTSDKK